MTETATGEALSVERALKLIESATTYEVPLVRRTEGATFVTWGAVIAGALLSMVALAEIIGWPWFMFVPIPWVAVGYGLNSAIWRITRTTLPEARQPTRRTGAAFLVVMSIAVAQALGAFGWQGIVMSGGLGLGWLILGFTNLPGNTKNGRRSKILIGGVTLLLGFAAELVLMLLDRRLPDLTAIAMSGVVAALAPIGFGLWQSIRG